MGLIESIIGLLLLFWVVGLALHVAGALIHLLLVVVIVLFIVRFLRNKA